MLESSISQAGFYVMSGEKTVGKWENETFTLIDKALAPMYLANTGNVRRWLEIRASQLHLKTYANIYKYAQKE